jgi:hypothetical protein
MSLSDEQAAMPRTGACVLDEAPEAAPYEI